MLPKVVESLLEATSKDNPLSSWCIFQEKNGNIIVKLRFESSSCSVNRDQHCTSYKRKSTRQVQRDSARSAAWKARKPVASAASVSPCHPTTDSLCVSTADMHVSAVTSKECECAAVTADVTTPTPSHSIELLGTRTRSMARLQDDVEQLRTEAVSPVCVFDISLPSPSTAASILNPAATCFSPMLLECGDVRPCPLMSVHSTDTINDERAHTTDTESVGSGSDIITSCRSRRCAYTEDSEGSGDEGQDSLYWCELCTYHICCNCVDNGGHNSHKWKLTRRSMKEYDKLFMLND